MQFSPLLGPLLDLFGGHRLVDEILLVSNSPAPAPPARPKVRVLHSGENLFVNPSWNLGVHHARTRHVIISNDDVTFDPALIDDVARRLGPGGGIVGPHTSALKPGPDRPARFLPAYERTPGFGVLMFLAKADWVPIPDELQIWCGDDFQFHQQRKRNLWFFGRRIATTMGTTSRRPEFTEQKHRDLAIYSERWADDSPYLKRFGLEASVVNAVRATGRRLRGLPV
jgi:hypothetical protein